MANVNLITYKTYSLTIIRISINNKIPGKLQRFSLPWFARRLNYYFIGAYLKGLVNRARKSRAKAEVKMRICVIVVDPNSDYACPVMKRDHPKAT